MARPIKQGLGYFPFDVDFFSDEKMYAISGEFGLKGEITTIKLLCAVYRSGYFIEWTEMLKFKLLKELPGVSPDLLEQIVRRLVKWDFFDKGLFDSASILTSRGIQRRYQDISAKMHRKNSITVYCLIDAPQPASAPETPQAPKTRRAAKKAGLPEPKAAKTAPVSIDDSVAAMLSDSIWHEPVCMRYHLTPEQFRQKVAEFRLHCLALDKREHDSVNDAKRHFCNLLAQGKLNNTKPAADAPTDYTYSGGFGSKDS